MLDLLLVSHVLIVEGLGRQLSLELLDEGPNHRVTVVLQEEAVRLVYLAGEHCTGIGVYVSLSVRILDICELIDGHLADLGFHGVRVEVKNTWLSDHVHAGIFWVLFGCRVRAILESKHLLSLNIRDH